MPLPPNTRLGRYEIRSPLGAGGMGEVYLAEDTELERQVALKILLPEVATDEDRVRRFVQEAKAASALNHPNILTVYDIGSFESSRFIATELIKGETLRARLQGEPLTLRETLEVAAQIVSALNAAHSAGIVHRDIKPENVMVRDDGLVKVLDFGLAKLMEKKTLALDSEGETRAQVKTSPGMVMGTVSYMSPEQARGKEIDARSDVWSVGVVVYEMLAGETPFAGETTNDTISAILTREPAPLDGNTPPELQRILRKALQKRADERYQTIKDFLLDLKNLKRELEFAEELERSQIPNTTRASNVGANQIGENATAVLPAAVSTQPSLPQPASSAEYIAGEVRKYKLGVALGSLVLLALVGVGLWFFFNRAPARQIESIAVMPFVNESGNADNEYLSDGMTETLIRGLSQLPGLNVKARSSVFRYKGEEIDPKKIAAELNVQAVLNGRVAQRGEQLALSLELIDARTENVIWADRYDRKSSDLLSLQNEIARDVSSKLKTKLSGADEQKLAKTYTNDPEAYRLYLQGRFYWNKRAGREFEKSERYFRQAVEKDPNFALGYVGLADYYGDRERDKAKENVNRALALDDGLAEAHGTLSYQYMLDYDWAASERHMKRALELDPKNLELHRWDGQRLMMLGRYDEALASYRRALEIDPTSSPVHFIYGACLVASGQLDKGIEYLENAAKSDPSFVWTHSQLSFAYRLKGNYARMAEERAVAQELLDRQDNAKLTRDSFARGGRDGFLREMIRQDLGGNPDGITGGMRIASAHALLGDHEKALATLESAAKRGEFWLFQIKYDPAYEPLRGDPRFQSLVRKFDPPQ